MQHLPPLPRRGRGVQVGAAVLQEEGRVYLVQWGEGAARKRRKVLLAGEKDGRRCWGSGLSRSFGGERRLFGDVQTMGKEMEGADERLEWRCAAADQVEGRNRARRCAAADEVLGGKISSRC
ncbi:hypothetical protein AAC387_Pa05g0808 [Persea americana]